MYAYMKSVILILIIYSNCVLAQNWIKVNSYYPYDNDSIVFLKNYFVNAKFGWTVSTTSDYSNKVFKTTDWGVNWEPIITLNSGLTTFDIFAIDTTHCWIVRQNCTIYRTVNSGLTWDSSKINDFVLLGSSGHKIHFFDKNRGILFAEKVWITQDGGIEWIVIHSDSNYHVPNDISFPSRQKGWIVGSSNPYTVHAGYISATTNGGNTWEFQENYSKLPYTPKMVAVEAFDSINIYAVGNNSQIIDPTFLKSSDGGINWIRNKLGGFGEIINLELYDKKYAWMIERTGRIYFTCDSGITWNYSTIDTKSNLENIQIFRDSKSVTLTTSIDLHGPFSLFQSSIENILSSKINTYQLAPSSSFSVYNYYPNPFNNSTIINGEIFDIGYLQIIVYDIVGRQISYFRRQYDSIGKIMIHSNDLFDHRELSSGIYLCRFIFNGKTEKILKITMLK